MKFKLISLILAAAAVSTGCTSVHISQVDENQYLGTKMGGLYTAPSELLQDIIEEAAAYCDEKGLRFKLLNYSGKGGSSNWVPGVASSGTGGGYLGGFVRGFNAVGHYSSVSYPEVEALFTCLPKANAPKITSGQVTFEKFFETEKGSLYYAPSQLSYSEGVISVPFLQTYKATAANNGKSGSSRSMIDIRCNDLTFYSYNHAYYNSPDGTGTPFATDTTITHLGRVERGDGTWMSIAVTRYCGKE